MGILDRLGITVEELELALEAKPSLRGVLIGYLAEGKLSEIWFSNHPVAEYDDHDRTKKGDRWITYKGHEISIEVKSLQSNFTKDLGGGQWSGKFQVDASDKRKVTLPNGDTLETTCLVVGEFDLLAINLFDFGETWRFAFVKNSDLPQSKWRKYTAEQRKYLLQTTPPITWPLQPPYQDEPFGLLDEIVAAKTA